MYRSVQNQTELDYGVQSWIRPTWMAPDKEEKEEEPEKETSGAWEGPHVRVCLLPSTWPPLN